MFRGLQSLIWCQSIGTEFGTVVIIHILLFSNFSSFIPPTQTQSISTFRRTFHEADLLCPENPSCLQATLASTVPQASSHTVPHLLFRQTSTRPSFGWLPPANLIPPSVQAIMYVKMYKIVSWSTGDSFASFPDSQPVSSLFFCKWKFVKQHQKHWEEDSGLEHSRGQGDLLRRPCHPDYTQRECLILAYYYTDREYTWDLHCIHLTPASSRWPLQPS